MAAKRKCLSTDDEFRQAVADSLSVRQVLSQIGLVPAGGNYKTGQEKIKSYLDQADVNADAEAARPGRSEEAEALKKAEAEGLSHTKAPGQ